MRKEIKDVAVGDWVCFQAILEGMFCGRAAEIEKITKSTVLYAEAERKVDNGYRMRSRKALKSIRAVFTSQEEAEDFAAHCNVEFWKMHEQIRDMQRKHIADMNAKSFEYTGA